ncbi:MAG: response regulator [Bacteroidetes bacterium]|nr:response regulator [Bacteroidota bacterium]
MKKKVLVVEDEEMQAKLIVNTLLKEDCEVFLCEEGNYAVSILTLNKFDIIFLDLNIPKVSGLLLLQIIRSDSEQINFNTPVVICTASSDQNDKAQSLQYKANEYLVKPILPEKIRETVAKYI